MPVGVPDTPRAQPSLGEGNGGFPPAPAALRPDRPAVDPDGTPEEPAPGAGAAVPEPAPAAPGPAGPDGAEPPAGGGAEPPFEAMLEELEAIVARLEAGDEPLDRALSLFQRGIDLVRRCNRFLDDAERRIQWLLEDEAGNLQTVPAPELDPAAGEGGWR